MEYFNHGRQHQVQLPGCTLFIANWSASFHLRALNTTLMFIYSQWFNLLIFALEINPHLHIGHLSINTYTHFVCFEMC